VWLKNWSEVNQRYGGNPHVGKYIGVYFAFGVGSAALVVVQTLILWIFCSIEVSAQSFPTSRMTRATLELTRGARQAANSTSEWPLPSSAPQ
jgi:hypothetical protein